MKWGLRLLNAGHVELVETSNVTFLDIEYMFRQAQHDQINSLKRITRFIVI